MSYKPSITSFMSKRFNKTLTSGQELIQETLDSCRYSIISNVPRCSGVSTAIGYFLEWELMYSDDPLQILVPDTPDCFPNLEHHSLRVSRDTIENPHNGVRIKFVSQQGNFRGMPPFDIVVMSMDDLRSKDYAKQEEVLQELMIQSMSNIGKRFHHTSHMNYNYAYDIDAKIKTRIFEGTRFIIETPDPEYLYGKFSHIRNISIEDIGVVAAEDLQQLKHTANLMSDYLPKVKPMTNYVGQVVNIHYTAGP